MIPLARRPATKVVVRQCPCGAPAGAPDHVRGCAGLVQEYEAVRIHVALPDAPAPAVAGHIRPVLLGGSQALFLCDRPRRCSMSAMVDSAFTTMPRACRASRIPLSVIPGLLVAIVRGVSACGSRMGRRWPPILAGAVLPVWRTRCINLMAADALTAKRPAACRIVLPPSTARTSRSRRSWDKGAVIMSLAAHAPSSLESEHLTPCNSKLL